MASGQNEYPIAIDNDIRSIHGENIHGCEIEIAVG